MEPVIIVQNLIAGYRDLVVLRGMSLTVSRGSIVALLGQNGAGKTTLLKVLMGLVAAREGDVVLRGTVSYVPQGRRVFPLLSVKENVLVASEHTEIPASLIALFPVLAEKQDVRASDLSGGEQQMVALARGLVSEPEILLLDEPSLGLSPKLVREMFQLIDTIRRKFNITVLVVEHNLTSLLSIVDTAYVLEKGQVVETLEHDALKDTEAVYRSLIGK